MSKLIVNADDFGITEGVTLGILKAHRKGIVTSTTMMMNMPAAEFAAELSKDCPDLGVGIHITLTTGKPLLSDVPSLVDKNGNFIRFDNIKDFKCTAEDVYREAKAQLEKFIQVMGKKPSHLDSHHFSMSVPQTFEVARKLCREYEIPYRASEGQESAEGFAETHFTDQFYGKNISEKFFMKDSAHVLTNPYVTEMMCHPGYVDYEIYTKSSYNVMRAQELYILTGDAVKSWVKDNHIELVNYYDLYAE